MAVGLSSLTNLQFRPDKPYRACLICGMVYQTDEDRAIAPSTNLIDVVRATKRRSLWAVGHAKEHSNKEHKLLQISGMMMTPEAAHRLAAFGLISVTDMVMSEEIEAALLESNPVPAEDAVDGLSG